jgi:UDP-GlcNAc:undecaprenyl-phosphate GlcNAc-1-phosphate transferase
MIEFSLYFFIPLAISYLLTPLLRRVASQWQILAQTNHRTVHEGTIPKWGGAAIFSAWLAGGLYMFLLDQDMVKVHSELLLGIVSGTLFIFLVGSLDDKYDLSCNLKLSIELLASLLAVSLGWRIEYIVLPGSIELALGIWSYPLSILWIVGVANAINLIDGLDGLASGIVIVVAFINTGIALLFQNPLVIVLSLILLGAVFGFLRYNVNPASTFMGDSGSLTLGFILACLTLGGASITHGKIALMVPLLLLGIPLTDTVLAIIRRLRRGIHPFHADREHIHHRLVYLGLSQSGAAFLMIGLSFLLGLVAFLIGHAIHTDIQLFAQLKTVVP